jgi:hypothetical protein
MSACLNTSHDRQDALRTVVGVAGVTDCLPPLGTRKAYASAGPFHRVPTSDRDHSFAAGWRTPWVLAKARPLSKPVPYKHPAGAVIWVNLGPEAAVKVEAQEQ